MKRKLLIIPIFFSMLFITQLCAQKNMHIDQNNQKTKSKPMEDKVTKTEAEWEVCLTPEQYQVLRQKGTEYAFTGKYYHFDKEGTYSCAACGNKLFTSDTKYDSGSGWPSFFKPINDNAIEVKKDLSAGMDRSEIVCGKCGGHLGHVFPDGPKPTGLRYCINSLSLDFEKK